MSVKPKVRAYDADTPPYNDQVRYFLKEGDTDLFRINASTGDIFLLRPLDRELVPEYTLTLVAMDTGECIYLYIQPYECETIFYFKNYAVICQIWIIFVQCESNQD